MASITYTQHKAIFKASRQQMAGYKAWDTRHKRGYKDSLTPKVDEEVVFNRLLDSVVEELKGVC